MKILIVEDDHATAAHIATGLRHHAGAIDMAKIQIRYGKDPKLVALAKSIVVAQEKEIAEMKAWQKAHPVQP